MSVSELPHLMERRQSRKPVAQFGHIPEWPVGSRFTDRAQLYLSGMHVTLQAGIQGRAQQGACSVVLSGGYEDDVDQGYEFTYTGHGGQLPRQSADRSQKKDQEWKRGNMALKISYALGKPVRVIRGYQLRSVWAPIEGYRYDGLYDVAECDRRLGKSGFYVCLFRFLRRPNQPPLSQPSDHVGNSSPRIRSATPSRTPPPPRPRPPPPHYSPPADIKALFPAGAFSSRPPQRPLHSRRTSLSNRSPEVRTEQIPSSSRLPPKNATTSSRPISKSVFGEGESSSIRSKQKLHQFSSTVSKLPQSRGSRDRSMSNSSSRSTGTIDRQSSEGSVASSISSKSKGKERAIEPLKIDIRGRSGTKHSPVSPSRETRLMDTAARVSSWENYYPAIPPRNPDSASDTDDGEFSEDEGPIQEEVFYDENGIEGQLGPAASLVQSPREYDEDEQVVAYRRPTPPRKRPRQEVEVIDISSSDEDDREQRISRSKPKRPKTRHEASSDDDEVEFVERAPTAPLRNHRDREEGKEEGEVSNQEKAEEQRISRTSYRERKHEVESSEDEDDSIYL